MSERVNFTKKALDAIQPTDKRLYTYDTKQSGLVLITMPSGKKNFYWYGRADGRPMHVKIGTYPDKSIEQARKKAKTIAGKAADGQDPRREKKAGTTLADLWDRWLSHAKQRKKTWAEDERKWNKHFAKLKTKRLPDIKPSDVSKWHSKLADDHGKYLANRCRALLSSLYSVADEVGYEGQNPCLKVKRFAEESRERFLLPDEMRPFFEALNQEPQHWKDFWMLCLLTGARRGNVAAMKWSSLDLDQGLWYVSGKEVKNKRPVAVVLPPPAVTILLGRQQERNGSEFVFPAKSATGYLQDVRKSWERVTTRSGIKDIRPHDLRRTLGSWQAIAGASLQVIGASLGHRDVKSTQVYARLQMEPVRESVNKIGDAMIEAGKPKKAKKK